ncbi:RagB/SusD family nutrient uptake outer membrane protein [Alistipes sp.]|uniref:RagB/SusD family nutrient uptake outer membrane protein n=1 Tax=Alistipes sp. TaxID=1872444 RepID=UPI003A85BD2B
MKRLYYRILILATVLTGATSCAEWLDVQPKTSVEQDDLFARESGFKDALTGFYLLMGTETLYAQDLTYYYLDMLAGRYESAPQIVDWTAIYAFDGNYQSTVNTIYSKIYNIIANINNFLYFVDAKRNVITTPHYYETMKGEALGLRAFLHFDLLRLFGPVYSENPDGKAVPYRKEFNNVATPILPAREVLDNCIADLLEAEKLLEGHDSEIFNYDDTADAFTEMRQMRMNLWAVRAMLARAYCYKGDSESKATALKYAKSVIESGKFTLANYNSITTAPVMPTEQIFALYIYDYYKIVDPVFVDASSSNILSAYQATVETWYETSSGGASDKRFQTFRNVSDNGRIKKVSQKYNQDYYSSSRDNYSGLNSQSLIRLAEMYYIAAECEPDPETAASYLNAVIVTRTGQNSSTQTKEFDQLDTRQIYGQVTGKTVRINELMKEYVKEFYGEGQLYFFYKRLNFKTFSNCPLPSEDMTAHYQMPLPNDEYTFGNNN